MHLDTKLRHVWIGQGWLTALMLRLRRLCEKELEGIGEIGVDDVRITQRRPEHAVVGAPLIRRKPAARRHAHGFGR